MVAHEDAYLRHQRTRWLRPDGARWVEPRQDDRLRRAALENQA